MDKLKHAGEVFWAVWTSGCTAVLSIAICVGLLTSGMREDSATLVAMAFTAGGISFGIPLVLSKVGKWLEPWINDRT